MRNETATVGHIDSTYELLNVDFVEKEQGSLVYLNHLEVGDNKHTLTYTYDVYLVSYASIESQALVVSTNNTNVSIISYTSIMINQTPQSVNVKIGLKNDIQYEEEEQLNFQLVFNLSGSSIPENFTSIVEEEPTEEEPLETVYNMNYETGFNQTFQDGNILFESVQTEVGRVTLSDSKDSKIKLTLNPGTLDIIFGRSDRAQEIEVSINGVSQGLFERKSSEKETFTITQANTLFVIQNKEYSSGAHVNEIVYRPN